MVDSDFKFCRTLFAFHIPLIPLGKGMDPIIFHPTISKMHQMIKLQFFVISGPLGVGFVIPIRISSMD